MVVAVHRLFGKQEQDGVPDVAARSTPTPAAAPSSVRGPAGTARAAAARRSRGTSAVAAVRGSARTSAVAGAGTRAAPGPSGTAVPRARGTPVSAGTRTVSGAGARATPGSPTGAAVTPVAPALSTIIMVSLDISHALTIYRNCSPEQALTRRPGRPPGRLSGGQGCIPGRAGVWPAGVRSAARCRSFIAAAVHRRAAAPAGRTGWCPRRRRPARPRRSAR